MKIVLIVIAAFALISLWACAKRSGEMARREERSGADEEYKRGRTDG